MKRKQVIKNFLATYFYLVNIQKPLFRMLLLYFSLVSLQTATLFVSDHTYAAFLLISLLWRHYFYLNCPPQMDFISFYL
jgi:hypothetical protein